MDRPGEFTKRPGDAFVAAVEMKHWPMKAGDFLVASNARGDLGVLIEDESGADVTSSVGDGNPPWIEGAGQTQIAFWLVGGAVEARYKIVVTGPTNAGELLTGVAYLTIRP